MLGLKLNHVSKRGHKPQQNMTKRELSAYFCVNMESNPATAKFDWWQATDRRSLPNTWAPFPDSKVHGANMGPIWGRQDPDGPHVGPMTFVIWGF